MDGQNRFEVISEREEYRDGKRLAIHRAKLKTPTGAEVEWAYQETRDGVVVVAVNAEGRLALKREWRLGRKDFVWELPSGWIEGGSAEESAAEELGQEVGVQAARLEKIGEVFLSNHATTKFYVFLARDLSPVSLAADEHEHVEVNWLPFAEAEALLLGSQVPNAQTVVALAFAGPRLG
jgi:8-oxo-dGTP pyrophosphatase MutT (NUDIX family)